MRNLDAVGETTGRGQQVQLGREKQHEQDAEPEGRRADAGDCHHRDHPINDRALAQRSQNTKRDGDQRGNRERHQRKLDGRRQPIVDELEDILAVAGAAEKKLRVLVRRVVAEL